MHHEFSTFCTKPTMHIVIVIAIVAVSVALFILARDLYRRSVKIRNRMNMDRLMTDISHELLTPLTVISASVDRLREQEPRYGTDYALMQLNVERMVRLLQQIIETSKLQSGQSMLKVSQGDVMLYIHQTALCLEHLMYKQGLDFQIHCSPKSMMGWIDTDKLDKIIYNLLSNAAKYSGKAAKVVIDAQTNKTYDHIIIKVSDNGPGIPPEQMKHLFRRFVEGNYRRTNIIGHGLGLSLTRDLVELLGGTITCDSQLGQGTTFTVVLPINKEAFDETQIDEQHLIDPNLTRSAIIDLNLLIPHDDEPNAVKMGVEAPANAYRLLIVEDNDDLLMLMHTLLGSKYRVVTAHNGEEALNLVRQEMPDLVISDVMMPVMDGSELTRQLKSTPEWSHLPVILLTAKTSMEERQNSMLIGADGYVTKPFRLGDLELCINNLIENRKRILRDQDSPEQVEKERQLTPDEMFVERARQCVFKHLGDSDFDRDAFASEMGASTSTLYNRLRAITGMNVSAFIRDIRLQEARRLAQTKTNLRVSDLAYRVGFKDPKYFATSFKKEFGVQPREFMDSVQK